MCRSHEDYGETAPRRTVFEATAFAILAVLVAPGLVDAMPGIPG